MDSKPSRGAGDLLVKTFRKQSVRAKERMLEKFGKADKTQDELFDEYVNNISKQQNNGTKLQKEIRGYVAALKALDVASKSLHDALNEVYEPEWTGQPQLAALSEQLQISRTEHLRKLNDDLQNNVATYLNQFPEIKNKISKRGRKLVDYDAARYALSSQMNASKRNDAKAAKAQDELDSMQRLYESVSDELHRELPAAYDSRVGFYGNTLKLMWETEATYHSDAARVFHELAGNANHLAEQGRGTYKSGPMSPVRTLSPISDQEVEIRKKENGHSMDVHYQAKVSNPDDGLPRQQSVTSTVVRTDSVDSSDKSAAVEPQKPLTPSANSAFTPVAPVDRSSSVSSARSSMYPSLPSALDPVTETRVVRTRRPSTPDSGDENEAVVREAGEEISTRTRGAGGVSIVRDVAPNSPKSQQSQEYSTPTADGPADVTSVKGAAVPSYKVLYKVKATNPYVAEDQDELSFDSGDTISVIPYENPEEQDEGWLMGVKDSDGARGVFPANFTKLITP